MARLKRRMKRGRNGSGKGGTRPPIPVHLVERIAVGMEGGDREDGGFLAEQLFRVQQLAMAGEPLETLRYPLARFDEVVGEALGRLGPDPDALFADVVMRIADKRVLTRWQTRLMQACKDPALPEMDQVAAAAAAITIHGGLEEGKGIETQPMTDIILRCQLSEALDEMAMLEFRINEALERSAGDPDAVVADQSLWETPRYGHIPSGIVRWELAEAELRLGAAREAGEIPPVLTAAERLAMTVRLHHAHATGGDVLATTEAILADLVPRLALRVRAMERVPLPDPEEAPDLPRISVQDALIRVLSSQQTSQIVRWLDAAPVVPARDEAEAELTEGLLQPSNLTTERLGAYADHLEGIEAAADAAMVRDLLPLLAAAPAAGQGSSPAD